MGDLLSQPAMWVVAAAALAAGMVRGFAGFGAGMVYVPVAAAAFGPRMAAASLFVIDTIIVLPLVVQAARQVVWREILPLGLGAAIAVPAGVAVLLTIDPVPIRWGLSVAILIAVAVLASGWRYRGEERLAVSFSVGGLAGFLGGVAQIPGPPVIVYWLGRDTPSARMRANSLIFFCFTTVMAGIAYFSSGLFTVEVTARSFVLLPVYGIGLLAGSRLFSGASETVYRGIAYALVTLVAVATLPAFDGALN